MADAFSRHMAILHDLGQGKFKEKLRDEQKADLFCVPLIYYLESGDDALLPNHPLPAFKLEVNVLVRLTTLKAKHETDRDVKRLVIPSSLVRKTS